MGFIFSPSYPFARFCIGAVVHEGEGEFVPSVTQRKGALKASVAERDYGKREDGHTSVYKKINRLISKF